MTKPIREYERLVERFGLRVVDVQMLSKHILVTVENQLGMRMLKTMSKGTVGHDYSRQMMIAECKRFARGETHRLKILPVEVTPEA